MHVFNWFFLFIIGAVVIMHVMINHSLMVSGKIEKSVDPAIYFVVSGFAFVWLILYVIQIKTFGQKPSHVCLVLNGILTGFWVMIYAFLNMG